MLVAVVGCTVASEKAADTAAVSTAKTTPAQGDSAKGAPHDTAKPKPPAGDANEPWTANASGAGPVQVGMTAAEVRTALGMDASTSPAAQGCSYLAGTAKTKLHATVMLTNDTVVRVDVIDTVLKTAEGARVGDTEARIQQLYAGRVSVQPHKYVAGGHYLVVTAPGDANNRLVFETDGKVVKRYRVGREPEVEYVESCL
jgi:hypothetical protein